MPKIRSWTGKTPRVVTGRLIRDTGSGLIVEDIRGVRYFARWNDVLDRNDESVPSTGNLFAPL